MLRAIGVCSVFLALTLGCSGGVSDGDAPSGDPTGDAGPSATGGGEGGAGGTGTQRVNPLAYNAFVLWRDGPAPELLALPAGYQARKTGSVAPDEVFYVAGPGGLLAKYPEPVTPGATVTGNILEYPANGGRTLRLKFGEILDANADGKIDAGDNVPAGVTEALCRADGMRLPTARELYDFCTIGGAARCNLPGTTSWLNEQGVATVSLVAGDLAGMWVQGREVYSYYRNTTLKVRCVASP